MYKITEPAAAHVATAKQPVKFSSRHVKNITGQRFGSLTAIAFVRSVNGNAIWKAVCDCGGEIEVRGSAMTYGKQTDCGCKGREKRSSKPAANSLDLTGRRFGRLVALRRVKCENKSGAAMWVVRCDCGGEKIVAGVLLGKKIFSCGCLYRESRRWKKDVVKCKKPPGAVERTAILWKYKDDARKRSLEWALSDEQFFALTAKRCNYCGSEPMSVKRVFRNGGCLLWNGVDRVDNSVGYTVSNCVPCCKHCNHAKRDMTLGEFISWVKSVYRHCFRKTTERKTEQPSLFPSGPATPSK